MSGALKFKCTGCGGPTNSKFYICSKCKKETDPKSRPRCSVCQRAVSKAADRCPICSDIQEPQPADALEGGQWVLSPSRRVMVWVRFGEEVDGPAMRDEEATRRKALEMAQEFEDFGNTRECERCGGEFVYERPTRRFCSPRCRCAADRERRQGKEAAA